MGWSGRPATQNTRSSIAPKKNKSAARSKRESTRRNVSGEHASPSSKPPRAKKRPGPSMGGLEKALGSPDKFRLTLLWRKPLVLGPKSQRFRSKQPLRRRRRHDGVRVGIWFEADAPGSSSSLRPSSSSSTSSVRKRLVRTQIPTEFWLNLAPNNYAWMMATTTIAMFKPGEMPEKGEGSREGQTGPGTPGGTQGRDQRKFSA